MAHTSSTGPEDHRRKWDSEEYERIAIERLRAELEAEENGDLKQPAVKRRCLQPRDYRIDLDSNLGKSTMISRSTPHSQSGGYYCNVCDCVVKDSINFLDHVNGKKHQRNLGMSMRVERSTLQQVKDRFALNKRKVEENAKGYNLQERIRELREEQDRLKEYRKAKRQDKKKKANEAVDDDTVADPEIVAMMGFAGFGSVKN